jgi:hypothetical protein
MKILLPYIRKFLRKKIINNKNCVSKYLKLWN